DLMRQLNLDKIPTIVIESKSYVPNKAESLRENKFLIRANKDYDNIVVAKSLIEAAKDLELAYEYDFDTLDRGGEDFIQASKEFGEKISRLGNKFKKAHRAEEKVNILADLALLVSQDGAGLSFMSNKLQKDVGSAGMLKGTSAVISLLVTEEYIRNYKIPYITETDTKNYKVIIKKAIMLLHQNLEKAEKELREKFDFKPEAYSYLFK
ncbi:MAG TPA: hypothetical protein VK031_03270, partial [Tissierellaceae bacterium]|nr:hypothetical protein [Tissierellaceae bacterium]